MLLLRFTCLILNSLIIFIKYSYIMPYLFSTKLIYNICMPTQSNTYYTSSFLDNFNNLINISSITSI